MHQWEQGFLRIFFFFFFFLRFLEDGLLFFNNKKMVTILRRELEHKGGKVKHKVGGHATEDQNNMNFQPE